MKGGYKREILGLNLKDAHQVGKQGNNILDSHRNISESTALGLPERAFPCCGRTHWKKQAEMKAEKEDVLYAMMGSRNTTRRLTWSYLHFKKKITLVPM